MTGSPESQNSSPCAHAPSWSAQARVKKKNQMDVALSAIYTWDGVGIGSLG